MLMCAMRFHMLSVPVTNRQMLRFLNYNKRGVSGVAPLDNLMGKRGYYCPTLHTCRNEPSQEKREPRFLYLQHVAAVVNSRSAQPHWSVHKKTVNPRPASRFTQPRSHLAPQPIARLTYYSVCSNERRQPYWITQPLFPDIKVMEDWYYKTCVTIGYSKRVCFHLFAALSLGS